MRVGFPAAVEGRRIIGMKAYRQVEARDGVVKPASRVSRVTLSDRGQVSLLVCFGPVVAFAWFCSGGFSVPARSRQFFRLE